MRLKVKERSDLILPLTILDNFQVDVRRLTLREGDELSRACSRPKPNRATGAMEMTLDPELFRQKAPARYIAGWRGLTPGVLRRLGIDLQSDPETDADGCVAYDPELAEDLWQYAHGEKFALAVMNFSREMLSAEEVQKKSGSTVSGS